MSYSSVNSTNVLEKHASSIFRVEDPFTIIFIFTAMRISDLTVECHTLNQEAVVSHTSSDNLLSCPQVLNIYVK
jgi:hypothetical protein